MKGNLLVVCEITRKFRENPKEKGPYLFEEEWGDEIEKIKQLSCRRTPRRSRFDCR